MKRLERVYGFGEKFANCELSLNVGSCKSVLIAFVLASKALFVV